MNSWIITLIIAGVIWLFLAPLLGVTGGTITTVLFTFSVLLLMKWFGPTSKFVSAIPLNKNTAAMVGVLILVFGMISYGWFGQWFPLGAMFGRAGTVSVAQPTSTTPLACSRVADGGMIPDDIWGTSSSIIFNAYDMEANQPKSATVDLAANCEVFMDNMYTKTTADTTNPTALAGFAVGKKLDVWCGGTGYYTEPINGRCVDAQAPAYELLAHTAVAETDMSITGYDKTGATALTSGTSGEDDYTMAMGANQEELIFVQFLTNAANKAYNLCAVGTAKFTNITNVEPQSFVFNGVTYSWTSVSTPLSTQSIAIVVNETSGTATITRDYVMYKLSTPLLLHNWEWIKVPFKIKSSASGIPGGGGGTTALSGFALMFKDCQWARGGDGNYANDFYQRDALQADIGVAETETSPLGKTVGIIVETT